MGDLQSTQTSTSGVFKPEPQLKLICKVCQKQFSQYTCPRCNVRYCSLQCYKKHSLRCTESFNRENVMEELGQIKPSNDTKQKMLDILKRFHSENQGDSLEDEADDDEEDISISEETVRKVLEGSDISLDDLSLDERKKFLNAATTGKLSHLLKPWDPWWMKPCAASICLSTRGTNLVQSIDMSVAQMPIHVHNMSDITEDVLSDIPAGPENPLPSIRQLTKSEPSPLISVHIVDVIYSYCFMLRFFNGDWKSDPLDAAMVVLSLSTVLSDVALPETVSEALSGCLEVACSPALKHAGGMSFGIALFDDVCTLLRLGRSALVCAFMDLHRLLEAAATENKSQRSKKSVHLKMRSTLHQPASKGEAKKAGNNKIIYFATRKVFFLTCWINEQPNEGLTSLLGLVEAEKGRCPPNDSRNFTNSALKLKNEDKQTPKVLIEELQ